MVGKESKRIIQIVFIEYQSFEIVFLIHGTINTRIYLSTRLSSVYAYRFHLKGIIWLQDINLSPCFERDAVLR